MTDESNYADGEILWVTSQDVKVDYLSDTTTKLSDKGASELKLYPIGTLLMVTRSGILRHTLPVSMLRKPSTVNQDIRTISTNESCSSLWLMQHLKAHSKELLLEYGKTGTTVESIDFSKMKSMALVLPALDEQEAIGGFFYQLDNFITLHRCKCFRILVNRDPPQNRYSCNKYASQVDDYEVYFNSTRPNRLNKYPIEHRFLHLHELFVLTLMKGDEVVEPGKELADFFLLSTTWDSDFCTQ